MTSFELKCMSALAAAAVSFIAVCIIVAVPELIFVASIFALVIGLSLLLGMNSPRTHSLSNFGTMAYPSSVYVAPSGPGFFSNLFSGFGTHTKQHGHVDGFTSHQTGTNGFYTRNAEVHGATAAPSHGNTHSHGHL